MSEASEKNGSLGRVAVSPDIVFQQLDDEIVLLNLGNENYYSLDDVGARMWQLLAEYGDVGVVLERLEQEFDADKKTLRSDLLDLIANLQEAGLLTIESQTITSAKED